MISFWYCVHMLVESHNAVSDTCMLCASVFLSHIYAKHIEDRYNAVRRESRNSSYKHISSHGISEPKERVDHFNTTNHHISQWQYISSITRNYMFFPQLFPSASVTPCFL